MPLELMVAVFISAVVLLAFTSDNALVLSSVDQADTKYGGRPWINLDPDDFSIRTSSFSGGTLKVKRKKMHKATRLIVELFSLVVHF